MGNLTSVVHRSRFSLESGRPAISAVGNARRLRSGIVPLFLAAPVAAPELPMPSRHSRAGPTPGLLCHLFKRAI